MQMEKKSFVTEKSEISHTQPKLRMVGIKIRVVPYCIILKMAVNIIIERICTAFSRR